MAADESQKHKIEKILAWQLTKVRNKKEVIDEARKEDKTVHFASLMDICQLKNSELEPKIQKYKGRVVLRGDIVKYDSGPLAVSTEQGSSASQMKAAKACHSKATRMRRTSSRRSISLHPGQNGRCTIVIEKIPKSECPDMWIRLSKHKWPKSWSSMEEPVVRLERNLYGHPLAGL